MNFCILYNAVLIFQFIKWHWYWEGKKHIWKAIKTLKCDLYFNIEDKSTFFIVSFPTAISCPSCPAPFLKNRIRTEAFSVSFFIRIERAGLVFCLWTSVGSISPFIVQVTFINNRWSGREFFFKSSQYLASKLKMDTSCFPSPCYLYHIHWPVSI